MCTPKICVLIVVKNAFPLVKGALDSLKQQTFKDFEVVVVDGASTDGTLALLGEAANHIPLRIISEPDRSLSEGLAKALRYATGEIVGILCADERYYPATLEHVARWFEAEPNAVMCGGKVDFIDARGNVVGHHFAPPFELFAHLACEVVPPILGSFFNRPLIGNNFRYDADVPTCPDYEYWARLGFRFPASAFSRYDVSVAQAYRTRESMSFRVESFTQFCRDKLTHLDNLLAKAYAIPAPEAVRRRAAAGIHMWAAEQLTSIEPSYPDILAHCAEAARYDNSYERIAHFLESIGNVRYEPATRTIRRNVLGPRAAAVAQFGCDEPPEYWPGAAILCGQPLTIQTAEAPWGYTLRLSLPQSSAAPKPNGGQYWLRLDLEVIVGKVGVSLLAADQSLRSEQIFKEEDGRATALIPLPDGPSPVLIRSGGQPSSVMRLYRAELLFDPDRDSGLVVAIDLGR